MVRLVSLLALRPMVGRFAPLAVLGALAIPTGLLSLDHSLPAGACCTTYFPFVLLAAMFLGTGSASTVAAGSVALADALFMGPRYQLLESPMDLFGDTASLISSALIIGLVWLARRAVRASRPPESRATPSGIIFSLEKGEALASWEGSGGLVRLGPLDEVEKMMKDFIAQVEFGRRLTKG